MEGTKAEVTEVVEMDAERASKTGEEFGHADAA